jgi:hypothetical protein
MIPSLITCTFGDCSELFSAANTGVADVIIVAERNAKTINFNLFICTPLNFSLLYDKQKSSFSPP